MTISAVAVAWTIGKYFGDHILEIAEKRAYLIDFQRSSSLLNIQIQNIE